MKNFISVVSKIDEIFTRFLRYFGGESGFRWAMTRLGQKTLKANGLDWPTAKREVEKFNSLR
jgi:hypothetical protein